MKDLRGGVELKSELQIIKYLAKKHYRLIPGFTGYNEIFPISNVNAQIINVKAHLKNAFRKTHQEEYLKVMNDIAEENNQNFYVVVIPRSPEYRKRLKEYALKEGYNYDEIFKPLEDMKEKYNLKILNHFYDENYTDNDFIDTEHMIPSGALKFTDMIMKEIS